MGSKVLVVDDEPDVAKGWARALAIAGHQVLTAQDAANAIKLSRENPLDLVILDYMMPAMSGIELLNEIRKDHPFIRSIIISGKLDSSISEESVLADIRADIEADLYLHKPVDNPRLKDAVAVLLSLKPEADWKAIAKAKLESPKTKASVREAEKKLNKKKPKKK